MLLDALLLPNGVGLTGNIYEPWLRQGRTNKTLFSAYKSVSITNVCSLFLELCGDDADKTDLLSVSARDIKSAFHYCNTNPCLVAAAHVSSIRVWSIVPTS